MHGIIFDMDELLIDSRHIWQEAEKRLFAAMGHTWTADLALQCKGLSAQDLTAAAWRTLQPVDSLEHYQQIMRAALVEAFRSSDIPAMPGAVDLVRRLRGLAPMAVASGSPTEAIELAMQRLAIRDCFEVILSSESVARGKPAPDVFLKAAEHLQATAHRCLVFEDSLHGVRAALAAGMKVFAVPSLPINEIPQLATRTFRSLADVTNRDVAVACGLAAA